MVRNNYELPSEIEKLVKLVCKNCGKTKQNPPNMIVPINRGNGRTVITQNVALRYRDAEVRSFSSRESFLEYKLTGTASNVDEIHIDMQANSEYANNYRGIISLDMDDLLPKLSETSGNKFFEMVEKVKSNATLIIFVPSDCPKAKIDMLHKKMGISFKLLSPVVPTAQDLVKQFIFHLPKDIQQRIDPKENEKIILAFITKADYLPTYKAVAEAAQAFQFMPDALKLVFDITEKKSGRRTKNQENRQEAPL